MHVQRIIHLSEKKTSFLQKCIRLLITGNRGTQGLTYKLADELADEIHACEPAGGQPIESCAPFQVNSNFEGPG
jgi:hypothetical protein